ncbi:MAG: type III-B CRISPR module RAMP protein Cmr6 [Verrucomicrobia bacterium]|nr:type III-B CRISPR module RAMP protein Cmr6 [Verrucomicrobiota bacterium]
MPIYMPKDTRVALGENVQACQSRSLMLERFASIGEGQKAKDITYRRLLPLGSVHEFQRRRQEGLACQSADQRILYARPAANLMINLTSGVLESGGCSIHRFSDEPFIPGSAVKGCARRAGLSAVRVADTENRDDIVKRFLMVFGWVDQDLKRSGDLCLQFDREENFAECLKRIGVERKSSHQGCVAFFDAFPLSGGKLVQEIATPHNSDYYQDDAERALDRTDPVPIPLLAIGHEETVFVFPLRRMGLATPLQVLDDAFQWLSDGLETLGLGAKTASGYGFFNATKEIQSDMEKRAAESAKRQRDEQSAAELKRQEEASRKKNAEEKKQKEAELAKLSPEERLKRELLALSDEQFKERISKFKDQQDEQKAAIVRLLAGEKKALWLWLREIPQKGKAKEKNRFSTAVSDVFTLARKLQVSMPKS